MLVDSATPGAARLPGNSSQAAHLPRLLISHRRQTGVFPVIPLVALPGGRCSVARLTAITWLTGVIAFAAVGPGRRRRVATLLAAALLATAAERTATAGAGSGSPSPVSAETRIS